MAKTVRKYKFFTIFQYDLEEEYLREMTNKGLHLKSVIFPGKYTFEVGEPKDIVYRLDYKGEKYKRDEEYKEMLKENGWEYVFEFAEFVYYRKSADAENTELFSNRESRLEYLKSVARRRMLPLLLITIFFWIMHFSYPSYTSAHYFTFGASAVYLILMFVLIKDYIRLKNRS